ncbi:small multi-drug export protein [Cytobacillus sp. FSL R5-0569]|uniref:small multi-drug export protein n=1 Tax=Cytobacillus TaxID=2675230 RepID=UPI0027851BC1|nr:small multi-drug export protein [Cytobacillus kochii]MDQ0185847.1 putative membrane protein [Cytobacillus kochii]
MQEIQEFYINLLPALEDNIFLQLLSIFVLSFIPFFESYGAIPFGLLLGFPSIPVIIVAIAGNWVSVMAFIWIINALRTKVIKGKKKEKEPSKRMLKAKKYFDKYGVPGVSLAGIVWGFHISAAIALAAGSNKGNVSLWNTIAIIVWALAIGILLMSGISFLA